VAVLKGHREVVAELQKQVAALYARTKYSEHPYYYVDKTNGGQHLYGYTPNKPAGLKKPKNK
jgi:hypothetical protein